MTDEIRRLGREQNRRGLSDSARAGIRRRRTRLIKNERRKSRDAVEAFDRAAGACDECGKRGPLAYFGNGLVFCPDCLHRWRSLE